MLKAICLGRISYEIDLPVETMPKEGTVNEFFEKQGNVGGEAATIGCCLARWGISTSVAGVLGNDVFGTRIRKEFDKLRIDTRYIEPSYDNDTSISVVLVKKPFRKISSLFIRFRCQFNN